MQTNRSNVGALIGGAVMIAFGLLWQARAFAMLIGVFYGPLL